MRYLSAFINYDSVLKQEVPEKSHKRLTDKFQSVIIMVTYSGSNIYLLLLFILPYIYESQCNSGDYLYISFMRPPGPLE
ncbi:hypothetical protein EGT71_09230 [Atlantibacter subterranea]|uniref:Uncharacterized protein n=1 Tax=Atlantibacter subterraneus TaxID=255519 RepID=A0A3R9FTR1_9ENTR|nr:hypothetical protein EGK67_10700 [Atlantibacter subterranea]RSE01949.1 hypothetical protein EGT84_20285 [Atlantibacter subterranea]RSE26602.1 hypothetical protein EGT71_09230 [Atlantibacter subterranea]